MSIHHAIAKKADKLGVFLSENVSTFEFTFPGETPAGAVQAHWGERARYGYGVGAKAALAEIEAQMAINDRFVDATIVNAIADPWLVHVFANTDRKLVLSREPTTAVDALALITENPDLKWLLTEVPTDGAEAYNEGFLAGDNPFEEETDEAAAWDEAWDAAADEAETAEADVGGSVVKDVFRIRYTEAGHPTHCGDWLAVTLNNFVLGKSTTDLAVFEAICAANGVDTSKYKREGTGWQGRLRMTGRNLLAKKVYAAKGLTIPASIAVEVEEEKVTFLPAPSEWLDAQRFQKPKAA